MLAAYVRSRARPVRASVWVLFTLAAPLAGSACSDGLSPSESQLVDSRRKWADANIKNYTMVLTRTDGAGFPIAALVTVANGAIATQIFVDTGDPVPAALSSRYPLVEGLFDLVQDAFRRAAATTVTFDGTLGHPLSIVIDYEFSRIDDNLTLTVTALTALD